MSTKPSSKPVVLVTGASRGIGLSIVSFLLGATASKTIQTAKVVTLSRSLPQALSELQKAYPDDLESVQGDVLDEAVHKKAVEVAQAKWGRLDAVILNAGTMEIGRVGGDLAPSSFANQIAVNLSSLFTTCHFALPALRQAPSGLGRVVFISSGAAVGNYSAWAAYNASKAGLNALARTIANEEQGKVAVWALRPGVVDTDMIQSVLRDGEKMGMDASAIDKFRGLRDDGKLLQAEDPAHVVAALATRGTLEEPKNSDGSAGAGGKGDFISWDEPQLAAFRREK
ncbi:unnamed protein product [Parajaminaea phylloscopi]